MKIKNKTPYGLFPNQVYMYQLYSLILIQESKMMIRSRFANIFRFILIGIELRIVSEE